MSRRVCRDAFTALFAVALLLAVAGWWVAAGLAVSGCMYFAGRYHGAAERDLIKERERRLDAELTRLYSARRGQLNRSAGHLSPAVLLDRNSNSDTAAVRGAPAQVRADLP